MWLSRAQPVSRWPAQRSAGPASHRAALCGLRQQGAGQRPRLESGLQQPHNIFLFLERSPECGAACRKSKGKFLQEIPRGRTGQEKRKPTLAAAASHGEQPLGRADRADARRGRGETDDKGRGGPWREGSVSCCPRRPSCSGGRKSPGQEGGRQPGRPDSASRGKEDQGMECAPSLSVCYSPAPRDEAIFPNVT